MNNINCDIIKDLLPSYVDGISSTATNALVEEHLSSCPACRQTEQHMRSRENVIPGKYTGEIDFLKKCKNSEIRNICLLLLFVAVSGCLCFIKNVYSNIPAGLFTVLAPFMLGATYALSGESGVIGDTKRYALPITYFISLFLLTYEGILLIVLTPHFIRTGCFPFGLSTSRIGPVIAAQLYFILAAEAVLFFAALFVWGSKRCPLLLCSSIAGAGLSAAYVSVLGNMDTLAGFKSYTLRITLIMLAACLAVYGVFKTVRHVWKKRCGF